MTTKTTKLTKAPNVGRWHRPLYYTISENGTLCRVGEKRAIAMIERGDEFVAWENRKTV